MNTFTELRDRLSYIAIGGTQLLCEDIHLKKCLQNLKNLSESSAVINKVYVKLNELLSCPMQEQGKSLLELMGLLDAIICTQAPYIKEGEIAPVTGTYNCDVQCLYSEIHPIIRALTEKGLGKMKAIYNAAADHPQCFGDYRMIKTLIYSLGDTYNELAFLASRLIKALAFGESIYVPDGSDDGSFVMCQLPKIGADNIITYLKRDFDAFGKRNMERRISLIADIAGQKEIEWYLSLIKTAGQNIKCQAVYALSCSEENIPILIDIVQNQKGKIRQAAYKALGRLDSPDLIPFWKSELKKEPELALCLKNTKHIEISDTIAENVLIQFDKYLNDEIWDLSWLQWIPYKISDKILELFKWICENRESNIHLQENGSVQNHLLSGLFGEISHSMILSCPRAEYVSTHEKVDFPCLTEDDFNRIVGVLTSIPTEHQEYLNKLSYFICMAADFLSLDASKVYEKRSTDKSTYLDLFFSTLFYEKGIGKYWTYVEISDGITEKITCSFKEPLDIRWYDYFIKKRFYTALYYIGPYAPSEVADKFAEYYLKSLTTPSKAFSPDIVYRDMDMLKTYGCKNWNGLLLTLAKIYPDMLIGYWPYLFEKFREYAGDEAAFAEAKLLVKYYKGTKDERDMINMLIHIGVF